MTLMSKFHRVSVWIGILYFAVCLYGSIRKGDGNAMALNAGLMLIVIWLGQRHD